MRIIRCSCATALLVFFAAGSLQAQGGRPEGTYRSKEGVTLRLILGDSTVGREVSMGELTFPPNIDSGEHVHGSIEILYVLSGELEHTVDGVTQVLKPGMSGFVRPPGKIRHKTGPAGAKVLVVWVPGVEADKIISRWKREP
jgi:quercetin dioxygenase-like cupin family protein